MANKRAQINIRYANLFFRADKPTPPMGPLEIVEASSSTIDFKWRPPKDSGGCKIDNYILERQQVGRNTWKKVGPIGAEAKYKDSDVDHGRRYCYRIRVETEMGTSEVMETEDIQAGTKGKVRPMFEIKRHFQLQRNYAHTFCKE